MTYASQDSRRLDLTGIAIGRAQAQHALSAMLGSAESVPNRRFGQTREESRIEFPIVFSRRCPPPPRTIVAQANRWHVAGGGARACTFVPQHELFGVRFRRRGPARQAPCGNFLQERGDQVTEGIGATRLRSVPRYPFSSRKVSLARRQASVRDRVLPSRPLL